jgi:nucleoside-diphosphate-sugar epimerase
VAATGTRVRARRSARSAQAGWVAVTGAAGPLGAALVHQLLNDGRHRQVVAIDAERGDAADAEWRVADVRDPALRARLDGVQTLVHLAVDRDPQTPTTQRRAVNVRGTESVVAAAAAAGVRRVVLVTSAMVYGAHADNPVPLAEDAPLRAEPDLGLVGEWLEVERLARRAARRHRTLEVVRVRPASLVGAVTDAALPRLFEAPRLLVLRGTSPRWQLCHTDDLVDALTWAVDGRIHAVVTVGCDGWLDHGEVERISGMRSVVVPAAAAYSTADRLHRAGVLPAPASDLRYLAHPWVVGSQQLRAAGWTPAWTNEAALAAHLEATGRTHGARGVRKDATRAAAGAAVAVVGAVAIARARAARRRRR